MEILKPDFTEICRGLSGAEGPIFSRNGTFNMVAPFGNRESADRGDVVSVDLKTGQVQRTLDPLSLL